MARPREKRADKEMVHMQMSGGRWNGGRWTGRRWNGGRWTGRRWLGGRWNGQATASALDSVQV